MTNIETIVLNNSGSFAPGYKPDLRLADISKTTSLEAASVLLEKGYDPLITWYACDPDAESTTIANGMSSHLEFRSPENRDALQELFDGGAIIGPAIHVDSENMRFFVARGIAVWIKRDCD